MFTKYFSLVYFCHVIIISFRDALKRQYNLGQFWIEINIEDLSSFDEMLAEKLYKQPAEHLPILEDAAKEVCISLCVPARGIVHIICQLTHYIKQIPHSSLLVNKQLFKTTSCRQDFCVVGQIAHDCCVSPHHDGEFT